MTSSVMVMPPLTDPVILAQFQKVLAEWNYTGYITAKDVARLWIADNLPGMSLKAIAKAMLEYVASGGVIDQVQETRLEWNMWPFHYDFRLVLGGKNVYVETVLKDDDPNDPTLEIVSIHNV
jgi:transposase InsO family protein